MRKAFMASVCCYGAQGGALYADDDGITFRCQKLTVPDEYKNLFMPYEDITVFEKKRCLLVFPAVQLTVHGREHRFLVFNRRALLKILNEKTKLPED